MLTWILCHTIDLVIRKLEIVSLNHDDPITSVVLLPEWENRIFLSSKVQVCLSSLCDNSDIILYNCCHFVRLIRALLLQCYCVCASFVRVVTNSTSLKTSTIMMSTWPSNWCLETSTNDLMVTIMARAEIFSKVDIQNWWPLIYSIHSLLHCYSTSQYVAPATTVYLILSDLQSHSYVSYLRVM